MDEDENISMLLSMGFPDINEIRRALRLAKNDVNEAVAILTNEQPLSSYGTIDDLTTTSASADSQTSLVHGPQTESAYSDTLRRSFEDTGGEGSHNKDVEMKGGEANVDVFPVTNLYELETRVFQENWSIPYKRDESLAKCLIAAEKLARDGLMEQDDHCKKFLERIMPEAFLKLLTSHLTGSTKAISRHQAKKRGGEPSIGSKEISILEVEKKTSLQALESTIFHMEGTSLESFGRVRSVGERS